MPGLLDRLQGYQVPDSSAGIDQNILNRIIKIESGGNPNAVTGSYKGLLQLSEPEFRQYGGQGSIFDPNQNLAAGQRKLAAESANFQTKYGRAPTATDIYMTHQQGEGGYGAHMANPDAPAWQNMFSTGEGRQKGQAWSRRAIWGNIPDNLKPQFGSVDNVKSSDLVNIYRSKVEGGGETGATPPGASFVSDPSAISASLLKGQQSMPSGLLGGLQQGGGLLSQLGVPEGISGPFKANKNAFLGYLAGALQGGNLGQSIGRGLGGLVEGSKLDTEQARQGAAQKALFTALIEKGYSPQEAVAGVYNPEASKLMLQRAYPEEKFHTASPGNVFGIQKGPNFTIGGAVPKFEALGPDQTPHSWVPPGYGLPQTPSQVPAQPVPQSTAPPAQPVPQPSTSGLTQLGPKAPPKPPEGKLWIDPNNPAAGVRDIPGTAKPLPMNEVGIKSLIETAQNDLPKASEYFLKPGGILTGGFTHPVTAGLHAAKQFAGQATDSFEIGRHQRTVGLGAEAALRMATGAAAPESEVKRYQNFFMPRAGDSEETRRQKLDGLQNFLTYAQKNINSGRAPEPEAFMNGVPERKVEATPWTTIGNIRIRQR